MDKKRGLINVLVSLVFSVATLFLNFLAQRYLIRYVGVGASGLNSLYLSIIGFLSVAELGVGTAVSFSMYKPIVTGDKYKVAGLYSLFKKLYLFIGIIIGVSGLIVTPFIPYLAKDYSELNINVYVTFLLMHLSTLLTYVYSAKVSLMNAYKCDYLTTTINSLSKIFCRVIQIVTLLLFRSFEVYLACRIVSSLLEWVFIELACRKTRKDILSIKASIDKETKKEVSKNIKAMFMHKIGALLVSTADSIIISSFIGIVILGKYSNYLIIMTAMNTILGMLFTPLTSVIGHMCKSTDQKTAMKYFNFMYVFSFIVGLFFFLGYYSIIDELVIVCFGDNLNLGKQVSFIITLNFFIQFMRKTVLLFRDATGCFYYDRFKPLAEGILNVLLSILFVLVFPDDYKVVGVLFATIITSLVICHIIEPLVLFKHEFKTSAVSFYFKNYSFIFLFAVALFCLSNKVISLDNVFLELVANGFISVGFSLVIILFVVFLEKDFRYYFFKEIKLIKSKILKKNNE